MPQRGPGSTDVPWGYGTKPHNRNQPYFNRGNNLYAERQQAAAKRRKEAKQAAGQPSTSNAERSTSAADSSSESISPTRRTALTVGESQDLFDEIDMGSLNVDDPIVATPRAASDGTANNSGGGTTTGGSEIQYVNNPSNNNKSTFVFKSSILVKSWGNKHYTKVATTDADATWYLTSLAWVPVECLKFYMTKAEFKSLPFGAYTGWSI